MPVKTVGIRELKAHLSRYLKEVRSGSTIIVTDRSAPIARIEPLAENEEEIPKKRIMALRESGVLSWSGKKLDASKFNPVVKLRNDVLASDLLLEDRD